MIFDLVQDFADTLEAIPETHLRFRILRLLDEALRTETQFIDQRPTTLFQCMWNNCWTEVTRLETQQDPALCVAYASKRVAQHSKSKKEQVVFVATDGIVEGFRDDGSRREFFQPNARPALAIAVSPAADRVAVGGQHGEIDLIDADYWHNAGQLICNANDTTCVTFSPNGNTLASASDQGVVRLWGTSNDTVESSLESNISSLLESKMWSPNSTRFFGYGGKRVPSFAQDHHAVGTMVGGETQTVFSPNSRFVAIAGWGRGLIVWDLMTAQPQLTVPLERWRVRRAFFSESSQFITVISETDADDEQHTWDVFTEKLQALTSPCEPQEEISVKSEAAKISAQPQGIETVFRSSSGLDLAWYPIPLTTVGSPNGKFFVGLSDRTSFPFLLRFDEGDECITILESLPYVAAYCSQCGAVILSDSPQSCDRCGVPREIGFLDDITQKKCADCEAWNPITFAFCTSCGSDQREDL